MDQQLNQQVPESPVREVVHLQCPGAPRKFRPVNEDQIVPHYTIRRKLF